MYVSRSSDVTIGGETVTKATPSKVPTTGQVVVDVEFNSEGTRAFARLTSRHVGRQLAIVLDDIVRSAPVLRSEINNGRCEISGSFTWKEASELAGVLNAGALKAPIRIIETRSVSPSLGEEAISKGTFSAVVGVTLVFIFMLCYYLSCGVVADIALLLNVILWPAGMIIASGLMSVFVSDGTGSSSLGQLPVLTLPGVAGLVLSVGMAVDANVLIFERIREEFRLGKTVKSAVAAGYDRAFLAIFDSNLTTLITGVILFIFGSGPIRGFAVTLCGGIIISMFTALVVTRLIFNLIAKDTTKPYKMCQWVKDTIDFDFLHWAKTAIIASGAVIVVTLGIFFFRAFKNPASVMAVDFTGGVALIYEATDAEGKVVALDTEKVRAVVSGTGVSDQTVQNMTGENGKTQTLVKTSTVTLPVNGKDEASANVIEAALDMAYPEYKVKLESKDLVGSQIGSELKKDAFWATLISLICIIIYVSFRFQFGFALGGVVALAHDALITLGIFTICGNQVSLTTVAALLTIVGYSINDTIVIFDRIREEMARDEETPFPALVRKALNQTLSRTVLTTLSTLLAVCALYLFGGAAMHDFAFALFIGMIAGTYSTLFIAPAVMLAWYRNKRPRKVTLEAMASQE
jgi:SecD/SecF fusion protein